MTLNDLYRRVLEDLAITAANEAANPEDTAFVAARYTQLYSMLLGEDLVQWSATDDLPENLAQPIVMMLKFLSGPGFSKPVNAQEGALHLPGSAGGPSLAERQLRSQLAHDYVLSTAYSEYF